MNYKEARAFMKGKPGAILLGLERVRALLAGLGHPEKDLRIIHIAGTNGKGSILSICRRFSHVRAIGWEDIFHQRCIPTRSGFR